MRKNEYRLPDSAVAINNTEGSTRFLISSAGADKRCKRCQAVFMTVANDGLSGATFLVNLIYNKFFIISRRKFSENDIKR